MINIINDHKFNNVLWAPSNLATAPVGWFDANDSNTLNISAFSWGNKGSKGGSASQLNEAIMPQYRATDFNGKPSIYFNGSSFLGISPLLYSDPDYLYIIGACRLENAPAARVIYGYRSGTTELIQVTYQTATNLVFQMRASNNVIQQPSATFDPLLNHFLEAQLNVINSSHFISANAVVTGTNTYDFSNFTFNSTTEVIGATNVNGSINVFFKGWCAELIFLNYIPSNTEKERLQGYIAHKWGLSLPIGHPYKNNPPYV